MSTELDRALRTMRTLGGIQLRESDMGDEASQALTQAVKFWRSAVKLGDDLLEGVQNVATVTEKVMAEEGQRQRAYLADVRGNIQKVQGVSQEFYNDFRNGREALYVAAKLWEISTRRSGKGTKKSKNISGMDADQLAIDMSKGADNLATAMGKMLEAGAKVTNMMKSCVMDGCPAEKRESVISAGLDFRDLVSEAVFGRVNGIMRRAVEMMNQFDTEAARFEGLALNEGMKWVAPWERDDEITGEVI
jgi:hypothetical protein